MAVSLLKDKHILAVDDEEDILETIEDILDEAHVDRARDYDTASQKIRTQHYDLAILDIMGVNGMQLLEEAVAKDIPTVMLTAHAINPETLMEAIRKGAISYLPKETLAELDELLEVLLQAYQQGRELSFGAWKDEDYPHLSTFEDIKRHISSLRGEDQWRRSTDEEG